MLRQREEQDSTYPTLPYEPVSAQPQNVKAAFTEKQTDPSDTPSYTLSPEETSIRELRKFKEQERKKLL